MGQAMGQAMGQPAMQPQGMPFGFQQGKPVGMPQQQAPQAQQPFQPPQQGWPFGFQAAPAAAEPLDPAQSAKRVLELVNVERAKAGLEALTLDDKLSTAAQKHSEDMAKRGYMAHVTPDGVDPWTRMGNEGAQGVGENIARDQMTPEDVVQAWMDDPPHRAIILSPRARTMGLGVADGKGRLWTQDFGV